MRVIDTSGEQIKVHLDDYSATDWVPVGFVIKDFYKAVEEYERHLLSEALNSSGGWIAPAARMLSLNRTTFSGMLAKYNIHHERRAQHWKHKQKRLSLI